MGIDPMTFVAINNFSGPENPFSAHQSVFRRGNPVSAKTKKKLN